MKINMACAIFIDSVKSAQDRFHTLQASCASIGSIIHPLGCSSQPVEFIMCNAKIQRA